MRAALATLFYFLLLGSGGPSFPADTLAEQRQLESHTGALA